VAWPQLKQARLAVLYQEELQAGRQSVVALPLPSKGSHDPTESQAAAFGAIQQRLDPADRTGTDGLAECSAAAAFVWRGRCRSRFRV
jgi:hypothetical protein